ncbi:MAG: peroxiredoxin [Phycisphaerales bacterium]
MLAPGTPAPPFTLPDHDGAEVSLAHLLRSGPAVLFFYPGDFTPACTAEACVFRDMHDLAANAGVTVAGINPGSPRMHARFRAAFNLPFRLLSDRGKRVARQYEAVGLMGLMVRRVTYLVSQAGVIEDAVEASLDIARHKAFMRKILDGRSGA